WGLMWILWVAEEVAALGGTVTLIPAPATPVLPMLSLGVLWLILWNGPLRWAGAVAAISALLLWTQSPRPDLLISQTGGLVGIMTAEGRALSKPRGDGFAASVWLENDGDGADQKTAAARLFSPREKGWAEGQLAGIAIHHLSGKTGIRHLAQACSGGAVVVTNVEPEAPSPAACRLIGPSLLR
ncbi:MAG: competence protein, partial [Pseudomonadota bacterium]